MKRVAIHRRPPPPGAASLPGVHPVLERIYQARGVAAPAELALTLGGLAPFHTLSGIAGAADLLAAAVREDRRIVVVGDFDADGATSTAVAVRALGALGARHVGFLVPNRLEFGYGLTPEIVAVAARRSPRPPDLLVTVDNGISSLEGVAAARAHGMRVLVTDHHLPGPDLPPADAIVNPNLPGDGFPSKHLAGVGVIFYVMLALRARLRARGWFHPPARPDPNLARLLDLVALGTVADVARLDRNNRILVAQGLERIRRGRGQAGVEALLRVAGRDPAEATAADLAFAAAPRLNAAGRLTDMSLGIECLLCDDPAAVRAKADALDALNRERRALESAMQAEAAAQVAAAAFDEAALPEGLCLFDERWHPGIVGLVAARMKDRLDRPVVAFAPDGEAELKGSARSVPGLHVRDAIAAVAAARPALVGRFGGHAMAAGLGIRRRDLAAFAAAFAAEVARRLPADALAGRVLTDGALAPGELVLDLAEAIRAGGPWGEGFPEPVFDGEFEVLSQRVVGGRHLKLELAASGERGRRRVEAIAFNVGAAPAPDPLLPAAAPMPRRVLAAFRLDVNRYRGGRRLQLLIEHLEPL